MIVQANDPVLLEVCEPVPADYDIAPIVEELWAALEWSRLQGRPGDGLSAPQIGLPVRIFVVRGYPPFVNPRILRLAHDTGIAKESCLSLPRDVSVRVERPVWVKIVNGRGGTFKLRGRDARVFLHEFDHLQGILITDRKAVTR